MHELVIIGKNLHACFRSCCSLYAFGSKSSHQVTITFPGCDAHDAMIHSLACRAKNKNTDAEEKRHKQDRYYNDIDLHQTRLHDERTLTEL